MKKSLFSSSVACLVLALGASIASAQTVSGNIVAKQSDTQYTVQAGTTRYTVDIDRPTLLNRGDTVVIDDATVNGSQVSATADKVSIIVR